MSYLYVIQMYKNIVNNLIKLSTILESNNFILNLTILPFRNYRNIMKFTNLKLTLTYILFSV